MRNRIKIETEISAGQKTLGRINLEIAIGIILDILTKIMKMIDFDQGKEDKYRGKVINLLIFNGETIEIIDKTLERKR